MKKLLYIISFGLAITLLVSCGKVSLPETLNKTIFKNETPPVYIEKIVTAHSDVIIEGARLDVANKSRYKDAYYQGGYPPEDEGVCTDLVWRAFKNAGIDLKSLIDSDIKANVSKFPRITGDPDPNIDFRRVKNHIVFFGRHGITLTNEVDANDLENLKQWQGGDIVTIERPEHMGIISDKRNKKGVPYVIHNMGPVPREDDCLESWNGKITGHFRYPAE